jgi:hypothetical protein
MATEDMSNHPLGFKHRPGPLHARDEHVTDD